MKRGEKLTKRAIRGNDKAFVKLISIYKIDLYKTALSYLKNEEQALEAIQEVTYRAYKNIGNVKEIKYIKTWLIRIMINYCIDQIKLKKHTPINNTFLKTIGKKDNYLHIELENAMETLDDRSREIITLMYFNDLKIKDIAKLMDRPEGTIKTWLNKALKLLRSQLHEKD